MSNNELDKIQTLHPEKGKTNKVISAEKYHYIRLNILEILKVQELTHTELMEALYQKIKDEFKGGVHWYGEVVKLDLEANGVIERTSSKPP